MSDALDRALRDLGRVIRIHEEKEACFKPPQSVANAAKRGLEIRQRAADSNKGGITAKEAGKQGIGSGVQRAVNLRDRDCMPLDTIQQMSNFFSRHGDNIAKSRKAVAGGAPPEKEPMYQSDLLWGGAPGEKWTRGVLKKHKGVEEAYLAPNQTRLDMAGHALTRMTGASDSRIGPVPDPGFPFRHQAAKDVYALIKDLSLEFPTDDPRDLVQRAIDVSPYEQDQISVEDRALLQMAVEYMQNGTQPMPGSPQPKPVPYAKRYEPAI